MLVFVWMIFAAGPPAQGVLCQGDLVQGRSPILYRPLVMTSDRPQTLSPGQTIPKGSLFSSWKVGSAASQSFSVVWNSQTKAFWIDLNRDGSFSSGEKWTLGPKPIEIPLSVDERSRIGLVRHRGEVPLIAIRGYIESQINIEGKPFKVYLLDGDADGCFHHVGIDRLWMDINRDGRIDSLVETFFLGSGIDIGGNLYLLKTNGMGDKIEILRRPKNVGSVRIDLIQGAKVRPRELVLNLVSEWGEWVQLRQIDKIETLPVGRYWVVDLEFQLDDGDQETWSYHFSSTGNKLDLEVQEKGINQYELLPQLRIHFQMESLAERKGAVVKPWIASSNGLTMCSCNKGIVNFFGGEKEKSTYTWTEAKAVIRLNEAGSLKLDEQKTGFS
jgi:hypothetical protein